MSDKIALSDTILKARPNPCQTPQNQARETLLARPKPAPEAAFDAAEASENAAPAPGGDAPPALPRPAHGLRQALADPPPADPLRSAQRTFATPSRRKPKSPPRRRLASPDTLPTLRKSPA